MLHNCLHCTEVRWDFVIIQGEFRLPTPFLPQSFGLVWCLISSENYADFQNCFLLLPGCVMPSTYPKKQKWRFLICLISQRKPLYSHHILSCDTCLTWISRFYSLPICPTTKCKLAHLFYSFFPEEKKKPVKKKKGHLCWYQKVMLFSSMLKCATTLPIWSWNYKSERLVFFAMWQGYRMHKKQDQTFSCLMLISLWFETIRMDLFWNNSSSYNNPQRSQN